MCRINRLDTPLNRRLFVQELRESWVTKLDAAVMNRWIQERVARWQLTEIMEMRIDPEAHGYKDWLENSDLER
jgi:hypothetical protein